MPPESSATAYTTPCRRVDAAHHEHDSIFLAGQPRRIVRECSKDWGQGTLLHIHTRAHTQHNVHMSNNDVLPRNP